MLISYSYIVYISSYPKKPEKMRKELDLRSAVGWKSEALAQQMWSEVLWLHTA